MSMKKALSFPTTALLLIITLAAGSLTACGSSVSKDRDAYRSYGITCMNKKEYENAIKAFKKALGSSTGVSEVEIDINFYLAEAYYRNNQIDEAIAVYDALVDYCDRPTAYYQRGNLYYCTGDKEKAYDDYDRAVASEKKNYEMYLSIYTTLKSNNEEERGKTYLEKALELSGEKGKDHFYKGRIAYELGRTDEAKQLLETALEQNYVEANFYLARIARASGDGAKVDEYLEAYLKSEEVDAQALVKAGEKEMEAGNYANAIRFFTGAAQQKDVPGKQQVMKNIIICNEKLGEFADALTALEDYVKEYPHDEDAAHELEFVKAVQQQGE